MKNKNVKKVIVYCRESRDDGFLNYERIETQRDILLEFCERKKLGEVVDIVLDDNISGTNFTRLDPIKKRILNGEIDIFLCKDASRIGRNLLDSLKFIEFLNNNKVELIFESETYSEDIFPIIAWFNERRAKDDSAKIRRVLKHKMESGSLLIKAPYGYIKDGAKLEIDTKTAPVVREIFRLFIDGMGFYEIANWLNKKGYPTPSQVKSQYENINRTNIWNKQHVYRILHHISYGGDMPYGMREKVNYKSTRYVSKDKSDWIIVKNHHEAIVDSDTFTKVQSMLEQRTPAKREQKRKNSNLFSGLLYCGRCNSKLHSKKTKSTERVLICSKNNIEGKVKEHIKTGYGCTSHRIYEKDLFEFVKNYIFSVINDSLLTQNLINGTIEAKKQIKPISDDIDNLKANIDSLKLKASKIYDDNLSGNLPKFLFLEKIKEISDEIEFQEKLLSEFNLQKTNLTQKNFSIVNVDNIFGLISETGITNNTINSLFKKIIYFEPNEISSDITKNYILSKKEYEFIKENGGVLFVQDFKYTPK